MKSKIQKKLASKISGRSKKKVKLDPNRLDEITEAITREDIKTLIKDGAIKIEQKRGVSRPRARKRGKQKVKGRRRGQGTRKGKTNARLLGKRKWINRIRLQRNFLKELKEKNKITNEVYKDLYAKAKGGFFRSKRHIKLYMNEHGLFKNGK